MISSCDDLERLGAEQQVQDLSSYIKYENSLLTHGSVGKWKSEY